MAGSDDKMSLLATFVIMVIRVQTCARMTVALGHLKEAFSSPGLEWDELHVLQTVLSL